MKFSKLVLIIAILLSISSVCKSQDTFAIYPETTAGIDDIFTADNANLHLFEIGFPEVGGGPIQKIEEHRQGLVFLANSDFAGPLVTDGASYLNNDLVSLGYAQTAGSQLDRLSKYTVTTNNVNGLVLINFKFKNGAQTAYSYDCKYRIFNKGPTGNLVFMGFDNTLLTFSRNINFAATPVTITGGQMYTLNFTVTQLPAASGNQVKITFNGNNINVGLGRNPTAQLELSVGVVGGVAGNIAVGAYWVIINTNGTTLFTTSGSTNCGGGNGCIEGYVCVGTTCQICHGSCRQCSIQDGTSGDSSSCSTCETHTVGWFTGSSGGKCNLEYVDLSQFNNVSLTFEPPRTDQVTMGMWTFISDMTGFNAGSPNNPAVNVSLSNFLVMSYYATSANNMTAVCNIFEKTKPNLKTQPTQNGVGSAYNTPTDTRTISITNTGGRWFYSRCAMSFWSDSFYLLGKQGANEFLQQSNIAYEDLWSNVKTDVHLRYIYRSGDVATLEINNASTANSKYYIKNLYIMRDYMEPDNHFQYWNMQTETSPTAVPFMLLSLGFDVFNTATREVEYHVYQAYSGRTTQQLVLIPIASPNYKPPDNFRRLPTHKVFNFAYSTTDDLEATTALTVGAGQLYVFTNSLAFVCATDFYLNVLSVPSPLRFTCAADCPTSGATSYTVFPMLSNEKGQCKYACQLTADCPSNNTKLNDMLTYFDCLTGTNAFYECVADPTPDPFALFFSSYYTSENIVFTNFEASRLDSYIVELWWMRDNRHDNNEILLAPTPLQQNYIFYSNTLRMYQHGTSLNYIVETPFTNLVTPTSYADVTAFVAPAEWNKLIFNVRYLDPTYTFEFFIRNRISTTFSVGSTNTTNQFLQYIAFCHLDPANCEGNVVSWHSGYYRNLRVWNGDLASPWVISQYDQ